MTQRVVHLLEAVEVQIGDQRLVLPAVLPTRKRLGETLDEHAAVRQAGKRVDAGKSHRLAFALLHAARHRQHALQEGDAGIGPPGRAKRQQRQAHVEKALAGMARRRSEGSRAGKEGVSKCGYWW